MMKDEVLARENDWSGNTGYYLDENGNRITVGINDRKRFLEDVAQSGRKIEKIPTRRYIDRHDNEYVVPEDRVQDFFYEMQSKKNGSDPSSDGRSTQHYAEIVDFEKNGEIMSLPMWREQEGDRQKMREAGWSVAGQKDTETDGWNVLDFDRAAKHALSSAEDWGVRRNPETGKIEWLDSASEIGERAVRGTAGAVAGIGLGAAEMIGDAVVNLSALEARGVSALAGALGADGVERAIDQGIKDFRQGYEGVKKSADDWVTDELMGDTITQGTRMGKDLAEFGYGASKTYGEMGLGLRAIAKANPMAVPATFGIGGAEQTLEDEQVRAKGDWTARGIATVKGVTDAFAGYVFGRILKAFKINGADKAVSKTIGKAIAVGLGESVEGGLVMGGMEAVNQLGRGLAGVEDQMVDADGNVTEDPEKAVGFREATAEERVKRTVSAAIHGTVMTLGLKAAELSPRLMYREGMAKAVTYDVEQIRKQYAPVVAQRARTASALQMAGLPVSRRAFGDVKGVTLNGEVEFADGSVYYPAKPTRDVIVQNPDGTQRIQTVDGRSERIVVCDGTVLNAKGDVVGKLAGGMRLVRSVDTQSEAYARMTDQEAASEQKVTVFDLDTGRSSMLPDNILDIAPKAYREYNKWLMNIGGRGKKPGELDVAPQLDAESQAFGEIVNRLKLGGDSMHAAQMALGDIKVGRKTCRDALDLLRQAEAQVTGKDLVSVRSENSSDKVEDRESGVINPMPGVVKVEVKPGRNGELSKSVVDSAADICELGKTGELKPEEVDLTKIEQATDEHGRPGELGVDSNGEHGPIILRLNPETNRLELIDGNKRVETEKANGAKTVEAVVLREEDGWTKDNAQAVKDIANITSGNMTSLEMTKAFKRLGFSEDQAIEKGIIGIDRKPEEGWTERSLKTAMENDRRRSALRIAQLGDQELIDSVTDQNIMRLASIVELVNSTTFGDGWQAAQRAIMYEMSDMGYLKMYRAAKMMIAVRDFAGREIGYRDLTEVAKYYGEHYDELKAEGIEVNGLPGFRLVEQKMASDGMSRIPVVTPEGSVVSVDDVTSRREIPVDTKPNGVVSVGDSVKVEPGLELKADRGEGAAENDFRCSALPDLKVTIEKGAVTLSGVDADEMLDPRRLYNYAKVIGRLTEGMKEGDVLRVEPGMEQAVDVLLKYYDSSIRTTRENEARSAVVQGLLEKSGLADGVVVDQVEFDRQLAGHKGGQELIADGLTYGWTDGRKVYLNPKFFGTRAGLNTKIHEFGHLAWIRTKTINPELYARGMELAGKLTNELEALRKSSGYENYSEEKLREELIVKLIGDRGESIAETAPKGIVAEIKAWVNDVWRQFGAQFGIADLDAEKVQSMTIEDIADAVRAEMMSGRKFGERRVGNARGTIAAVKQDAAVEDAAKAKVGVGEAERVYGRKLKPTTANEAAVTGATTIDSPDGTPMYSIFSAKEDLKSGEMISELVRTNVLSKEQANSFGKDLKALIGKLEKKIAEDSRRAFLLDIQETYGKEGRAFNPWKPNSDPLYQISLDFSTLCKKRVLTQYVMERLEMEYFRLGENRINGKYKVISAEKQMAIRDMLLEYQKQDKALQVACHLCYVEAARLKAPKQINKYLADPERVLRAYFAKKNKDFDKGVKKLQSELKSKGVVTVAGRRFKLREKYEADTPKREMSSGDADILNSMSTLARQSYKPSVQEQKIIDEGKKLPESVYLTADNLAKLHDTHPDVFNAYTEHVRQSTHSKSLETDVPYYFGDSQKYVTQGMIDKTNAEGTGLRHQSWSDFQLRHLLDTIVAIADLSTRGARMHAYTKVPNFVEIMGRTGVQINMSLIPTVDGRGFDPHEGMDYATALALRRKFPETAGTIAISMSDAHLIELINNPNIDYVIPYHVSGLNQGLRKMVGIDRWKDATKIQHEKVRSTGKNAGKKDNVPELNEWLIRDMRKGEGYRAMEKSAERYVQLCNERGLIPKFAGVEGLLKEVNGKYEIVNKNYWKLLIDHKMVNQETGAMIEQKAVRPEFKFGRDKKMKDGIDDIIDREVEEFNPEQMDKAYDYVKSRLPELSQRTAKLKKEGAYGKLVEELDALEARKKGDDVPMLARPRIEVVSGRRVANDENRGEQTPGMLAASRELATQPTTPMSQLGRFRKLSLPISELEWLRQKLTGNNVPAHIAANLPGGAASASTRGGKLVIAADVFGDVDRTDYDRQKAILIRGGYFKNEDPTWCSGQTPQAIRAEKRRSEQQLGVQLENVAQRRVSGSASGGDAAARGVFADELANIIMSMDHIPAGTGLGNVRTIGEGIRRAMLNGAGGNEDTVRDEAGAFLDWAYGPGRTNSAVQQGATPVATRDLPLEDLTNRMFGALLTMPEEIERRAPRWSVEMRNAICSDQRMLMAFRELSMHAISEQAHERLMSLIAKGLNRDTEILIAKMEGEGEDPIKPKTWWGQFSEAVGVGIHDKMSPVAVRVSENMRIYRREKKRAIKAEPDPAIKAQLASELARFEGQMGQLLDKMETARLAMERGAYNEGRRYIMRELMLVNEATQREGLTIEDMCMYLDAQRVIETQGRAASYGETPRQAQLILDNMQRRLGPVGWSKMQGFAGKWWAIHEQEFLSDPRLRTAFGDDYVNYLESKTHYVTTSRTWTPEQLAGIERMRAAARTAGVNGGDDVVDDMFAFGRHNGLGAGEGLITAKLKGSFAAKKNVMAATWEKVDRAENFLRRNEYIRTLRDTLLTANVDGVRDVVRSDREIPEGSRYGRLNYIEDGQKRTLIVPKQIADGFAADPKAMEMYTKLHGMWRQAIIDFNPAYWNRNIARNSGSIEKNMPGTKETWVKTLLRPIGLGNIVDTTVQHLVRHFDKTGRISRSLFGEHTVMGLVPKAKRMAKLIQDPGKWQQELWAADDAGDVEKVAQMRQDMSDTMEMLKGNMLVPLKVISSSPAGTINDVLAKKGYRTIERINEEYNKRGKTKKALDALTYVFRRNRDQQAFEDDLAKITAYLHDRINFGHVRTVEQSGRKVAENVSIAQGERHGRAKGVIQGTVATFFNMVEKGIVRNVKAHVERPGEMMVKDAKVVAGVMIGQMIYNGVMSALMRKLFDDDEQKLKESKLGDAYEFVEHCRRARKNYSGYVKENFNCFPIWTSPSGRTSLIIGMPWNDEDKILVPGAQLMADQVGQSMGLPVNSDVGDTIVRSSVGAVTPDLALTGPAWTLMRDLPWAVFVSNPHDFFTGSDLYDKTEYEMRYESWKDAGKFGWDVAKQVWNDMGGRAVYQFDRNGVEGKGEEPAYVDVMLRKIPVASPVIRSFLKIQVGDIDKYSKVLDDADKRINNITTTLRREAAEKSTDEEFWSYARPEEFDAWMDENAKRYGLDSVAIEDIRAKITDDWYRRIEKPIKDDEKRLNVVERANRQNVRYQDVTD